MTAAEEVRREWAARLTAEGLGLLSPERYGSHRDNNASQLDLDVEEYESRLDIEDLVDECNEMSPMAARSHYESVVRSTVPMLRSERRLARGRGDVIEAHSVRARRAGTIDTLTRREWSLLCSAAGGRCTYCNEPCVDFTLEHIEPICRGGANAYENVVAVCPACNCRKNAKDLVAWAGAAYPSIAARIARCHAAVAAQIGAV